MTQHTPGPWRAPVTADAERLLVTGDNGEIVCTVWSKNFLDNSRLITAAPDLLEALRVAEILIAADIVRDDAGCLNKVRAAIAAATGGAT